MQHQELIELSKIKSYYHHQQLFPNTSLLKIIPLLLHLYQPVLQIIRQRVKLQEIHLDLITIDTLLLTQKLRQIL